MQQTHEEEQRLEQLITAFRLGDVDTCLTNLDRLASSGVFIPHATNPLLEKIMKQFTRMSLLLMCMDAYASEYEVRLAYEHGIYSKGYRDRLIWRAWREVSWENSMQRIYQHSFDGFMALRRHSESLYQSLNQNDLMDYPVELLYIEKTQTLYTTTQCLLDGVDELRVYPYLVTLAHDVAFNV